MRLIFCNRLPARHFERSTGAILFFYGFPAEYGLLFEENLFYDTKNEIGLRKTCCGAPEAFNHASKIGGKVLGFIAEGISSLR